MMMRIFVFFSFFGCIICPPPNRQITGDGQSSLPLSSSAHIQNQDSKQYKENNNPDEQSSDPIYKFPYSKYLELVVKILESQPKFQERIRGMKEEEIKSGKIADHIDELGHDVFEQLTKAKLDEINRLRDQFEEQIKREGGSHNIKMPEHLDLNDLEKFGKEDLRNLIVKTVADMNELDAKRAAEFKEYEMRKKAEEDHRLAQMSADEREKAQHEIEEARRRHNEHEPLKHPGGREQLEEVWEERDKMDKDTFDAKTFFRLHDLNDDGIWNEEELEALFQLELEKIYNDTNPDDDPREKIEDMHQMREHVVKQMDKNNDRMISLEEFLQDPEVQQREEENNSEKNKEGWEDLAHKKIYTDEELKRFEEQYAREKGWGEYAYDGAQTISPPATNQQQQQHYGQAPEQPHHPETIDGASPNQHQQQQAQQPPVGDKPQKVEIDPRYGI